ncbi:DMT family transporter [Sediminibacterium sp. TEGAF015]|uniref:DMT family transporter n=1 Tax=Sediminibacterium sp. TEGAF015 TaxID=575378 RepID=UPI0021FC9B8E|nr:EamA family transporter [Sediminibacterium sp. TEGAF015]BDQ13040.1 drug/metabolite exporter YedA [Sediminibacterium sp. TEGAF015]
MTTKQKAYFALSVTSIVWGTSWVASRYAVQFAPALQVSATRQLIAGSLFAGFFLLKGEKLPGFKQMLWLAGMSILLFVFANGLATVGVKYISSGLAALIAALYPLSVVIIEKIFFKNRKIGWVTFLGIVLGITGIAIVFYDNAFHHQGPNYWIGILVSVIAMLSWSVGTIIISRKQINLNPYYAIGWEMIFASLFLFAGAAVTGNLVPFKTFPAQTWYAIGYLVMMGSLIAVVAFLYTMKHLEASVAALYAYVNPIVAIIIGSFLIKEPLTKEIIIGSCITLIGVYLVNQSLRKQKSA